MEKKVKTFIEKGGFWVAEGPTRFQYIYLPARSFARTRKYIRLGWTYIPFVIKKQYAYQYLKIDETLGIIKNLLKGNKLDRHYNLWKKHLAKFHKYKKKFEKTEIKNISNKKLADLYREVDSLILSLWDISLIIEGAGMYADILARQLAGQYHLSLEKANYIINTVGKSPKPSFVKKECLDLLKLALLYRKKSKGFEKRLKQHQKEYFWIENNYKRAKVITAQEFKKRIKNIRKSTAEIKKEIKELEKKDNIIKIIRKYRLKREDVLLLKKFGRISMWIDERKIWTLKTNQLLHVMLHEIAKRLKLNFDEVSLLFPKEVPRILTGKKKIPKKPEFKKRENLIGIGYGKQMKNRLLVGKEAEKLISFLEKIHAREISKELKGTPTWNFGKCKGIVQIVLDIEKTRFIPGKILVTSMTRPEFVPSMKKAAAVITNEGGITCHAAIVSRELKIPCIIGTKNATRILKTGSKIELDSKKGIIKILK